MYSQTYKEVLEIKDLKSFKKVMIENSYKKYMEDDIQTIYEKDRNEEDVDGKMGVFWKDASFNKYTLVFQPTPYTALTENGDYDGIVENIKNKCEYFDIVDDEEFTFVVYDCNENNTRIGFRISNDGNGVITTFSNQ